MSKKTNSKFSIKNRLLAYRNLPKFIALVWKTSPWLIVSNGLLRLLQAILPLLVLSVGKLIIDQVVLITQHKNTSQGFLWNWVFAEFLLVIIIAIVGRIVQLLDDLIGESLTNATNVMIMEHAALLDLTQFEDSVFYDKLDRARQQTAGRALLLTHIFGQAQDILTLVCYLVVLVAFNAWIVIMLAVFFVPSLLASAHFNRKNYLLIRSQTEGRRVLDYLSLVGSSDATAKEIRLFGLSSFFTNRYKTISLKIFEAKKLLGIKQSWVGSLLNIPGAIGFYIAFIYIIKQVISGNLSIGGLTFMLGAIRQLGSATQNGARRSKAIAQGAYHLQDFFDFFKINPQVVNCASPKPFPNPILEGFTFEDVGFKYSSSSRWANRHLSFTLAAGEKLALVGENGAGKTTLVKLLVRLYDPTEGRVLLDGIDLKEYDLLQLRQNMGVIFQDFVRFQMSASENIAIGNIQHGSDNSLIIQSAKQSLAHAVIEQLPKQYDQMLGHFFAGGHELSGGQWQKVALARAYMRSAPLIILDEPTASLDARAEYEVFLQFTDVTKNKTAVIISHRFSTVRMVNRIIVLDHGQILEIGSHEELLKNKGRYAELFQLQAKGYI